MVLVAMGTWRVQQVDFAAQPQPAQLPRHTGARRGGRQLAAQQPIDQRALPHVGKAHLQALAVRMGR